MSIAYPASTQEHQRIKNAGRAVTNAWHSWLNRNQPAPDPAAVAQERAEIETGQAAYLAGIEEGDPILSTLARQGWRHAQRDYKRGAELHRDGFFQAFPHLKLADYSLGFQAGYRAAQAAAELAAIRAEMDSPFYSGRMEEVGA